jgi:tetratricopeptide (TPR) repeat protein
MGRCYTEFTWSGAVAPREFMPKAKAAMVKALTLDPALAGAHAGMGRILYQYDWDWARSEQEFRRALDLNPNDARTHIAYAALLRLTGRVPEAKAEAARVRELDPLTGKKPGNLIGAASGLRSAGKYDQAIAEIRKALQMDPSLPRGHYQLGLTLVEAGKLDEGITELETAVRLSKENLRFQASVGWAYALAGRKDDARKVLADLRTRSHKEYVSPVAMALIHVGLLETDSALQLLQQAYEQRDFDLLLANTSPGFRPVRAEPRFRELMKRIGLPEA